jgi:spermidine/putrescine transport system permease protein
MTVSAAPAGLFAQESSEESSPRARRWRSKGGSPHAHGLATITTIYLLWSLVPVAVAVLFSFNAGRSRSVWQGFSLRWYTWDPNGSILNNPSLRNALIHTITLAVIATVITVPLGVTFALALDRWRGRVPTGASFAVLLSFVIPEIALAIGLLFLVTTLATPFTLGTTAQLVGLITFQLSYDLGASALGAVRRVLLPMLTPAIMVSTILVFADVLDNFVIVRYLSADMSTETTSMRIYNTARAAPTPALNALATLILVASLAALLIGWLLYRRWSKGQGEDGGLGSFTSTL